MTDIIIYFTNKNIYLNKMSNNTTFKIQSFAIPSAFDPKDKSILSGGGGTNTAISREITIIENDITDIETQLVQLTENEATINNEINNIETQLVQLTQNEATINNEINDIETQLVQLTENDETINNEIITINEGLAQIQQEIQNLGGSLRNVSVLDDVGGSSLFGTPNNSVVYSLNQNPGQIVIDSTLPEFSPPVGSEYIIYAGNNNTVLLQTQTPTIIIQISGGVLNDGTNDVVLDYNSKVTITKISDTLWIAQGDGLSYLTNLPPP
jgi:hypothetical protein